MARSKVLAGGALTLTFFLASGGVASADPLSKSEWRTEAAAICSGSDAMVGEIAHGIFAGLGQDEEPTDEQLRTFADEVIPVIDDSVQQVVDLEEPAALKKNVKRWAKATRDVLAEADDDPSLFNTPDPFTKSGKIAKKLGLRGCN